MHGSPWEEEVEFILWVDWEQMGGGLEALDRGGRDGGRDAISGYI